uniref:Secreted protein n=1 Tax=Caenorhabditis tropicalis TaxID=1561998 RepID=A0A1I7TJD2_9PELO
MRSLFFFLLVVSTASTTIYWEDEAHPIEKVHWTNQAEHMDILQTQVTLILSAFKSKDVNLLYQLIPFGETIDRFLKNYQVVSVSIDQSRHVPLGQLEGKALVVFSFGEQIVPVPAILNLAPTRTSPTGYVMNKAFLCMKTCNLRF